MKAFRNAPPPWRWLALVFAVALVTTLVWLFFLRGSGGGEPGDAATATPVPQARPAIGRAISFDDYTGALDRALRQVERARLASGSDQEEAIEEAVKELEGVEGASVSAPRSGSAPAEIDNISLIAALREDDPDLLAIEESLSALLDSLDDVAGGEGEPGDILGGDEARGELREVLDDPAFNYERELSPLQRLARWLAALTGEADPDDNLWRWFLSLLAGLAAGALAFMTLERFVPNRWARLAVSVVTGLVAGMLFYLASGAMGATFRILSVIGLAVAAIAAVVILAALRKGGSAPATPEKRADLASVLGMGANEARRRAEEAAAGGDYRAAIRYRCLALLLVLDEASLLHFDRAATNSEYLFRAPGDLQTRLQPMLSQFEVVWYGNAGATEAEWRDYDTRAVSVEAGVVAAKRAA